MEKRELFTKRQELLELGAACYSDLAQITQKLIDWTMSDKIKAFSYMQTQNTSALYGKNDVYIQLYTNNEKMFLLGGKEFNVNGVEDSLKSDIEYINNYLIFANAHLNADLPHIDKTTLFSKKSLSSKSTLEMIPKFLKPFESEMNLPAPQTVKKSKAKIK